MERCCIIAATIAVVIIAIFLCTTHSENFAVSPAVAQKVYTQSKELFDDTKGGVSYTDFKSQIPEAGNVVAYTDLRNAWKKNTLSPANVQKLL